MTRLREALERAKSGDYAATAPASPATADALLEGGPEGWQFEPAPEPAGPEHGEKAEPLSAAEESGGDDSAEPLTPLLTRLATSEKLVVLPDADVTLVEQFRRLAAALHHAKLQKGARTVMIASAVQNEGKTLTATNLALTLSESYQRRVLLIDADLRRPSVHALFRIDNTYGLSDTLKHVVPDGRLPIHRVSPNLWVVPGGRPDPDPMSGLTSETMQQLLSEAVEQFDWVVIDTPPVALLPDANLLAAMIDTALLVVRANSTPYPLSARAVDAIGADRILGVVLNRAKETELSSGGYYYSHYRYSYGKPKQPERSRLASLFRRKSNR